MNRDPHFFEPNEIPNKVLEEQFGKKSVFHPMCCLTTRFIDEGYSIEDLVDLYKELAHSTIQRGILEHVDPVGVANARLIPLSKGLSQC